MLAWMAAYGSLILFVHIYSHTGKDDPLSVGNDGADRMAVAGAKAGRGDQAAIQRIALRSPRPARYMVLLLATITNSVQFRIARTARLIIW